MRRTCFLCLLVTWRMMVLTQEHLMSECALPPIQLDPQLLSTIVVVGEVAVQEEEEEVVDVQKEAAAKGWREQEERVEAEEVEGVVEEGKGWRGRKRREWEAPVAVVVMVGGAGEVWV